jgi:hypothetical protein
MIKISRPRRIHLTRDGYISKRSAGVGALPDAAYAYRGTGLPIYAVNIGDEEIGVTTYEFRCRSYGEAQKRARDARRMPTEGDAKLVLRADSHLAALLVARYATA